MTKEPMYIRTYTKRADHAQKAKKRHHYKKYETVLAFDCETTPDQFQNLLFGGFCVYHRGQAQHEGIMYDPENLNEKDKDTIITHCLKENLSLYTREEFVNQVFYPIVYEQRALCIGYNLPFDLTRIARHIGDGIKENTGAFSVELSNFKQYPRVMIRHAGTLTFLRFGGAYSY